MAYVAPTLRSVGDAVTAADQVIIANDILQFAPFVQGVFTTEAVRNAAITSPTEGMHAYLTASTETTAAGTDTSIPTGIQTIYNGSGWVTVTDVGSWSTGTGQRVVTNAFGATTAAGADPSVTLRTGTSALISFGANYQSSNSGATVLMGVAVTGASSILAGVDPMYVLSVVTNGSTYQAMQWSILINNLTAGVNIFTTQYNSGGVGTTFWYSRHMSVKGIA